MAGGNVSPQLGPLFAAAGAKYGIPANVLAGIASVETNLGDNISTSSTGAQGLMQFEPSTAKSLGVNPYNARSAIFGAAKLLVQSGYYKNPRFAIGAYNGGAGNPQYGYADQVLSEANRLKGQTARYTGQGLPAMPQMGKTAKASSAQSGAVGQIPQFKVNTTQGFDQAGYDAAVSKSIAGNYLVGQGKDPYAVGAPNTGLSTAAGANPLLASGALSTGTPNPADYQTAQTSLQQIADPTGTDTPGGTKVPLNQHPAAMQQNLKGTGYTNPLSAVTHWERTDQGVDANLPVGAPIRALGNAKVVGIEPNWYNGQPLVYYRLLDGPQAGKYVYVAEQINSIAKPGTVVPKGGVIARYAPSGTGIETGWATASGQTLAMATTGYKEGYATAAGKSFRNFLNGLGANAGSGAGLSIGAGADADDAAEALAAEEAAVRHQIR